MSFTKAKDGTQLCSPGAPHGLAATLQDLVNADLLGFIEETQQT